jgi:hypothetical protein
VAGSWWSTPTGECTPSTAPIRDSPPASSTAGRTTPPTGWAGRQLAALFAEAGMREPEIVAETFISTDGRRPTLPPFTTIADVAEQAGALTADEASTWLTQLANAGRRGQFFWAATMFAVGAVRR